MSLLSQAMSCMSSDVTFTGSMRGVIAATISNFICASHSHCFANVVLAIYVDSKPAQTYTNIYIIYVFSYVVIMQLYALLPLFRAVCTFHSFELYTLFSLF